MKIFFLIVTLLILTSPAFSQTHYIRVSPKFEKSFEHKEGHYDNYAGFKFSMDLMDVVQTEYCTVKGYISDPSLEHRIDAMTGYDMEYTEAQVTADSQGYFSFTVSTQNLPELFIAVFYMGSQTKIYLEDVYITFSGKRSSY